MVNAIILQKSFPALFSIFLPHRKNREKKHHHRNADKYFYPDNRVGETGLFPVSTSHTTVRTVRYTAVVCFDI
jgi:hypothetical protein